MKRHHPAAALIAAGMVVATLALGGCRGDRPVAVTLEELATQHERFDGATVSTQGTVRRFDDPLHYWIEDPFPHRVELEPHDLVESRVGQHVRVRGVFRFIEGQGRVIEVQEVVDIPEGVDPEVSAAVD
jgi:hypothetical protein